MGNKEQVLVSLTLVSQTCNAALESVANATHRESDTSQAKPLKLHVLHKDFLSLLSLLHGSTTKMSLTLKPASPSYDASLTPLKDSANHISALAHCINLFDPNAHGSTLVQEAISVVKDVIESTKALVQTFLNSEVTGMDVSSGQAGDQYMVRTGAVHDLIEKARALSVDNIVAVRKRWAQDRGSLDDGVREVNEMIQDAESSDVDDDEDEDDDGWDELGITSGNKMDKAELERTKKVDTILRLSTLLHKRILLDILAVPSPSSSPPLLILSTLDSLPRLSSAILSASDDLISTLYSPQDPVSMLAELVSFQDAVSVLQSPLRDLFQQFSLIEQLENMSLGGATSEPRKKIPQKWFDTCFEQIFKATQALAASLESDADAQPT